MAKLMNSRDVGLKNVTSRPKYDSIEAKNGSSLGNKGANMKSKNPRAEGKKKQREMTEIDVKVTTTGHPNSVKSSVVGKRNISTMKSKVGRTGGRDNPISVAHSKQKNKATKSETLDRILDKFYETEKAKKVKGRMKFRDSGKKEEGRLILEEPIHSYGPGSLEVGRWNEYQNQLDAMQVFSVVDTGRTTLSENGNPDPGKYITCEKMMEDMIKNCPPTTKFSDNPRWNHKIKASERLGPLIEPDYDEEVAWGSGIKFSNHVDNHNVLMSGDVDLVGKTMSTDHIDVDFGSKESMLSKMRRNGMKYSGGFSSPLPKGPDLIVGDTGEHLGPGTYNMRHKEKIGVRLIDPLRMSSAFLSPKPRGDVEIQGERFSSLSPRHYRSESVRSFQTSSSQPHMDSSPDPFSTVKTCLDATRPSTSHCHTFREYNGSGGVRGKEKMETLKKMYPDLMSSKSPSSSQSRRKRKQNGGGGGSSFLMHNSSTSQPDHQNRGNPRVGTPNPRLSRWTEQSNSREFSNTPKTQLSRCCGRKV